MRGRPVRNFRAWRRLSLVPCEGDADGTPHTNPDFCIGCGNGLPGFALRDVGVVVLDEAVAVDRYAELPEAGVVDTLKNKTDVDFVGCGVQFQISGQGGIPPRSVGWATPEDVRPERDRLRPLQPQ
jgi:hypothetical protein